MISKLITNINYHDFSYQRNWSRDQFPIILVVKTLLTNMSEFRDQFIIKTILVTNLETNYFGSQNLGR